MVLPRSSATKLPNIVSPASNALWNVNYHPCRFNLRPYRVGLRLFYNLAWLPFHHAENPIVPHIISMNTMMSWGPLLNRRHHATWPRSFRQNLKTVILGGTTVRVAGSTGSLTHQVDIGVNMLPHNRQPDRPFDSGFWWPSARPAKPISFGL